MILAIVVTDDETKPGPAPAIIGAVPEPIERASSKLDRIGRRVRVSAQNSRATMDRVDELRADLESRLGRFEARIGHVQDGVAEARESRARGEGKLDAMLQVLDAERKSRQAYESAATSALASVTEVQRTRALSQIDGEASDRAVARTEIVERRKYRRDIAIKIFAGVAAVWTAISTYLLAR